MKCVFYKEIECRKPSGMLGMCERCKIPNSFGYFFNPNKPGAEQRFILERERKRIVKNIDETIEQWKRERARILALPSRDDYYRRDK